MEKITTFYKPSDRKVIDFSKGYAEPYGNRLINQYITTINVINPSSKALAFKDPLNSVFTSMEETLEYIWVGIDRDSPIMAVSMNNLSTTNDSTNVLLTGRDYRGLPSFIYGQTEKNGPVTVEGGLVNIVCDTNDFGFVQFPSFSDGVKDTVEKIMVTEPTRIQKLLNEMQQMYYDLNILLTSGRFRSYLNMFSSFVSKYPKGSKTIELFTGGYEALNIYDTIWATYKNTLQAFFPTNFNEDTQLIIVEPEVLKSITVLDGKTERMFTKAELNLMLTAIGMKTIA